MAACRTVLVVDDDPAIRESLGEVLGDEGFQVVYAENGRMALEYLRACADPPCLVLLDLMMPVMNGWEFCREKEQDPALEDVKVVVISAMPGPEAKNACLDAAEVFAKPLKLDRLLE